MKGLLSDVSRPTTRVPPIVIGGGLKMQKFVQSEESIHQYFSFFSEKNCLFRNFELGSVSNDRSSSYPFCWSIQKISNRLLLFEK